MKLAIMRRVIISICLVLLLVPALTSAAPLVLRVSDWRDDRLNLILGFANEWAKTQPNVKFEGEIIPWDQYFTKLRVLTATGLAPQIVYTHNDYTVDLQGVLEPFPKALFPREELRKRFVNFDMGVLYPDEFYWMPEGLMPLMLWYRPSKLLEAGLSKPPTSWDEFRAQAKKLVRRNPDGKLVFTGAAIGKYTSAIWTNYRYQLGDMAFKADSSGLNINSPANIQAFKYVAGLLHEDQSIDNELLDSGFGLEKGNAALEYRYGNKRTTLEKSNVDWDVVRTPTVTGKLTAPLSRATYESGLGVSVGHTAEERDAAFRFIQWLYQQVDYHVKVNLMVTRVPGYREAWRNPEIRNDKVSWAMAQDADYYIFPGGYTPGEVGAISSQMRKDFTNGAPVERLLAQGQADADRLMAALKAKVILNVEPLFKAPAQ